MENIQLNLSPPLCMVMYGIYLLKAILQLTIEKLDLAICVTLIGKHWSIAEESGMQRAANNGTATT